MTREEITGVIWLGNISCSDLGGDGKLLVEATQWAFQWAFNEKNEVIIDGCISKQNAIAFYVEL